MATIYMHQQTILQQEMMQPVVDIQHEDSISPADPLFFFLGCNFAKQNTHILNAKMCLLFVVKRNRETLVNVFDEITMKTQTS